MVTLTLTLNHEIFASALAQYKRDFSDVIWHEEKYKWRAIQHFQDNWDVHAVEFVGMLTLSLAKTRNLLGSAQNFPRRMIREFAELHPERVRGMFLHLFDESIDLFERIQAFKTESASLRATLGVKSDYQNESAISTYLWLRYPDKYYIYKWSEARSVSEKLNAGYQFKKGDYEANLRDQFELYNQICDALQQDAVLIQLFNSHRDPECYADQQFKTLTIDVAFYISRRFTPGHSDTEWWPTKDEYDPGLSPADWVELLHNPEIFPTGSLEVVKRLKAIGGYSSCVGLANKFGRTDGFYNGTSRALAKRIVQETGCPVLTADNENSRWWPVLYVGRNATIDEPGKYVWKLRDELHEALEQVDLSHIPLYESSSTLPKPGEGSDTDFAHWWLVASPAKAFKYSDVEVGEPFEWLLRGENGNKRSVPQNFTDAKPGDLVVCYESQPKQQIVALATVIRGQDGESILLEKTESLINPVDYSMVVECADLQQMQALRMNMRGSLFAMTPTEYSAALELVRETNPAAEVVNIAPYSADDFVREVFMDRTAHERLASVLRRKKNLILQGAPGVGKTFAARRLAWSLMGVKDNHRIEFVQFHQNYSYEDFMMGYKPNQDGFELREGIFYRFCKKAAHNPKQDFFFIIDEINRGNMSKIFGELLMLIENEYRGTEATLAYNGEPFTVPRNVHIIGMMNTADRSLAMIDYALRRRFSFVSLKPGFESEGFTRLQLERSDARLDQLISCVKRLNEVISQDESLGSGFCVGHSYFCESGEVADDWLDSIVDFDILPMLEEYWFDEPEKVEHWRAQLSGAITR